MCRQRRFSVLSESLLIANNRVWVSYSVCIIGTLKLEFLENLRYIFSCEIVTVYLNFVYGPSLKKKTTSVFWSSLIKGFLPSCL